MEGLGLGDQGDVGHQRAAARGAVGYCDGVDFMFRQVCIAVRSRAAYRAREPRIAGQQLFLQSVAFDSPVTLQAENAVEATVEVDRIVAALSETCSHSSYSTLFRVRI